MTNKSAGWNRKLPNWWVARARTIDHKTVIESIDNDGSLSGSYLFMCTMAAGIAITGLLLNSPAVIIGAMLVSPLMGPIVRLGLGVTTLDYERAGSAVISLAAGMGIALLMAITIVWLSPIREVTPEILARTRPNLFDLLVATLSGLAGGYAMVHGRGGTIVGVAIATALMPPMTVVGYGIASGQGAIARGALLLFTTNLVAIALSITAMTTWYGFSRRAWRHAVAWQTGLAVVLIIPLLWPLFNSLQAITREARVVADVRKAVDQEFSDRRSRVVNLQVIPNQNGPIQIDLTVAAESFDGSDEVSLRERLTQVVKSDVDLRLTPVVMANPERVLVADSSLANPVTSATSIIPTPVFNEVKVDPMQSVIDAFVFPVRASKLDSAAKQLRIVLDDDQDLTLMAVRRMEINLLNKYSDWSIEIIPPVRTVSVPFDLNSDLLNDNSNRAIELTVWALSRWQIDSVRLEGRASSDGDGPASLAERRAQAVAATLTEKSVQVSEQTGRYPYPGQASHEAIDGPQRYRTVMIIPNSKESLDNIW